MRQDIALTSFGEMQYLSFFCAGPVVTPIAPKALLMKNQSVLNREFFDTESHILGLIQGVSSHSQLFLKMTHHSTS